jgi:hypothetical protein
MAATKALDAATAPAGGLLIRLDTHCPACRSKQFGKPSVPVVFRDVR